MKSLLMFCIGILSSVVAMAEAPAHVLIFSDSITKEITKLEDLANTALGRQVRVSEFANGNVVFELCKVDSANAQFICKKLGPASKESITKSEMAKRQAELTRAEIKDERLQIAGAAIGAATLGVIAYFSVKPFSLANRPQYLSFNLQGTFLKWLPMSFDEIVEASGYDYEAYFGSKTLSLRIQRVVLGAGVGGGIGWFIGKGVSLAMDHDHLGQLAPTLKAASRSDVLVIPVDNIDVLASDLSAILIGIK